MAVFGIDISAHNAGLNLQAAKNEGVCFAILRAGYTGYGNGVSKAKDTQFENFYSQCKNLGIPYIGFELNEEYIKIANMRLS